MHCAPLHRTALCTTRNAQCNNLFEQTRKQESLSTLDPCPRRKFTLDVRLNRGQRTDLKQRAICLPRWGLRHSSGPNISAALSMPAMSTSGSERERELTQAPATDKAPRGGGGGSP
mmetsp:Transcript_74462/g.223856  ORF Transcript_74462/g.223856 Transcript_74462/m.223856 type:complete len:116 (-) Transcript_74462:377-724(-)